MDRYSDRKSNRPVFITVVLTAAVIFVLYNLFLKGTEVEHVQKVRDHAGR